MKLLENLITNHAQHLNFTPAKNYEMPSLMQRDAPNETFINSAKKGSRHFWKHVKQCTGLGKIKNSINPWPCHDNVTSKISANKLNDCFINSITALRKSTNSKHLRQPTSPSQHSHDYLFSISSMYAIDIQRVINSLPNASSVGNDNTSTYMLKKSSP